MDDRIIAEVRQAREELGKRFNYDLRAMIDDARQRQAAGGRKVVAFPPRRVRKPSSQRLPEERIQPTEVADDGQ
jgi:hypothetical protein